MGYPQGNSGEHYANNVLGVPEQLTLCTVGLSPDPVPSSSSCPTFYEHDALLSETNHVPAANKLKGTLSVPSMTQYDGSLSSHVAFKFHPDHCVEGCFTELYAREGYAASFILPEMDAHSPLSIPRVPASPSFNCRIKRRYVQLICCNQRTLPITYPIVTIGPPSVG